MSIIRMTNDTLQSEAVEQLANNTEQDVTLVLNNITPAVARAIAYIPEFVSTVELHNAQTLDSLLILLNPLRKVTIPVLADHTSLTLLQAIDPNIHGSDTDCKLFSVTL